MSATGTIQPACWLPDLLTYKELSDSLSFLGHPYNVMQLTYRDDQGRTKEYVRAFQTNII